MQGKPNKIVFEDKNDNPLDRFLEVKESDNVKEFEHNKHSVENISNSINFNISKLKKMTLITILKSLY